MENNWDVPKESDPKEKSGKSSREPKLKVLVIHNDYQQSGGEYVAVNALITLLQKNGHTVIPYVRDNAEIQNYTFWQKAGFIANTFYSHKTYADIRDIATRQRPHIAHVHNVFPLISPSVYLALQDSKIPIIQTIHNYRLMCPNGLFYTRGKNCERCKQGNTFHSIRLKCYRDSYLLSAIYALTIGIHRYLGTFKTIDQFIALTEFAATKLVEGGLASRDRITLLGNFLADPMPQPGSFEQRDPFFVYLGRLSPEKGVDMLVAAMNRLPNFNLKILGDGPEFKKLFHLSRQGNSSNIEFIGYITGERKQELLRRASATVLPSACYENFPLAVLESFAVGTPVIASNLGGLPHLIENGKNGLLFETGDIADLQAKLNLLGTNPKMALQMGQYGRNLATKIYSEATQYSRLMAIYHKFVTG